MGCEALQRGARCVVAVDQDPQCIRVSRSNLSAVAASRSPAPEIRAERRELIAWLRKGWSQEPFDIVYFDPPYDGPLHTLPYRPRRGELASPGFSGGV